MKIGFFFTLSLLFIAMHVYAVDLQYGGEISGQMFSEQNYFSSEEPVGFTYDDTGNVIAVSPFASISNGRLLNLYLMGDIFWVHSFEDSSDEIDAELVNAFVSLSKNRVSGNLGKQPFSFGRGFIVDSNEPGISLEIGLQRSMYLRFQGARVFDSSNIASVGLGIVPGLFEKAEVFGVVFGDNDNAIAETLNQSLGIIALGESWTLPLYKSSGTLFWIGCGADMFAGDVYLTGTLILQEGNIKLKSESPDASREYSVPSFLIDVEAQYNLTQNISSGLFLFVMKGDQPGSSGELSVFIPPLPMNSRTAIFLNEKFGYGDSSGSVSAKWISLAGVVAPGIKIDYTPTARTALQISSALLYPYATPNSERTFFGWETDLTLTYELTKNQKLYFEADVFFHGNYYDDENGDSPSAASRFILGYNIWF